MLYVGFENPFFLKNMVVYFLNGGTDVVLVQGWKGVWWVVVDLEVGGLLEALSEYPKIIKKMEQTTNEVVQKL